MSRFEDYLRAGFPVVWVSTVEPHRAERELAAAALGIGNAPAYHWDVVGGFRPLDGPDGQPCSPVKAVQQAAGLEKATVFLWNLHRFLSSVEVIQAIQNAIPSLKARGSCLVVLAPDADKLPPELSRFVVTWDFPLPTKDDLGQTADRIRRDAELPEPLPEQLFDAALGLTEGEAEDAFALSVVERHSLDPGVVAREKAGALLRQAKIEMSTFTERFEGLGGLDVVKEYTLAAARSPMSRGILLLGPPGTGKSHLAKALGNELSRPTLTLDFGRLMGGLVGQSLHGDSEVYFCNSNGSQVERLTLRAAYEGSHLGYTFSCTDRGGFAVQAVTGVMRHVRKGPFYSLRTRHGHQLTVSGDHTLFKRENKSAPFPAPYEKRGGRLIPVTVEDLQIGQKVATVQRFLAPKNPLRELQARLFSVFLRPEVGALIGLYLGDGSLNHGMIRISCGPSDGDVLDFLRSFGPLTEYRREGARGVDCTLSDNAIATALHVAGVCGRSEPGQGHVKQLARKKRVPAWVFGASDEFIGALLRGYYSADGSFNGHNLEVSTASEGLSRDICLLLSRFGIVPYVSRRWTPLSHSAQYRLTISKGRERARFAAHAGFIQRDKQDALLRSIPERPHGWMRGRRRPYSILWDEVIGKDPLQDDPNDPYCYDIAVDATEKFFSHSIVVHNSEANIRAALQAIDAMGGVVLYLDEIEKGLAGVQSSGQLDSGVKAGVGSAFLRWMSDRKPGLAYVVGTCNDITQLPPEYTRSGRWDAVFWLDLPTAEEREVIWRIYEEKYQVTGARPKDDGWTGAEIFSCCRTAAMLGCDLQRAGQYIIPMSKTMAEKIEALRDWAKGRAVPASRAAAIVTGRRIQL